jgi:BphX-like protein
MPKEFFTMTRTKWWLRIVGVFSLLLVVGSLWVFFVNPEVFGAMFPFSADALAIRAFSDAWLIFVLEMAVLGSIMLYAAQEPARHGNLVLTVAVLEIIRGAGGDILWMTRGWPTANYIPFMVVHLIIAITGIYFVRKESANKAG